MLCFSLLTLKGFTFRSKGKLKSAKDSLVSRVPDNVDLHSLRRIYIRSSRSPALIASVTSFTQNAKTSNEYEILFETEHPEFLPHGCFGDNCSDC